MKPSFTVILVTYRRFDFFVLAVKSIIEQTFQDFECLIFNDYPEDNFRLKDYVYSLKDSRFSFFPSEESLGGNHWRNKGVSLAKGEIVAFLDDDDQWMSIKLARHFEEHNKHMTDTLVFSDYYRHYPNMNQNELEENTPLPKNVNKGLCDGTFSISTTSSVSIKIRKRDPIFDESLTSFQDWDAWMGLTLSNPGIEFRHINEPLLYFTQHNAERVSKNTNKRKEALNAIGQKYRCKDVDITGFLLKENLNINIQELELKDMSWLDRFILTVDLFITSPKMLKYRYTYRKSLKFVLGR